MDFSATNSECLHLSQFIFIHLLVYSFRSIMNQTSKRLIVNRNILIGSLFVNWYCRNAIFSAKHELNVSNKMYVEAYTKTLNVSHEVLALLHGVKGLIIIFWIILNSKFRHVAGDRLSADVCLESAKSVGIFYLVKYNECHDTYSLTPAGNQHEAWRSEQFSIKILME